MQSRHARSRAAITTTLRATVVALLVSACSIGASGAPSIPASAPASSAQAPATDMPATDLPEPGGTVTLYSTVTQATVDAIVAGFAAQHPGVAVDLFRAPTGEVTARIAAEQRDGGVKADLLWLTDPLSVQGYDRDGVLGVYAPSDASAIDPADQGPTYWGTRLLNMVIVTAPGLAMPPTDWADLTEPSLRDAIALPDPGFAGSAFGLLGAFAQDPAYGIDFYRQLKDNGAVIVKSPDDVTTGVAEGRFKAGITLDFSARSAITKGSPVELVWPASGAVTMYSPIAQVATSANATAAQAFIDYVLSPDGQALIAASGWQPARSDVSGGPPIGGLQVRPDWTAAFAQQDELLTAYRSIFGE